jgi:hypothetical protein
MAGCDDDIEAEQLIDESASCTDPNSWGFGTYSFIILGSLLALFAMKKMMVSRYSANKKKDA